MFGSFDELRKYFERDRFIIKNGIKIIEVCAEYCICKVFITEEHLNAKDVVQGGMIYSIADFTFAVHSNFLNNLTVTQTATISYIRPVKNCEYIYAKSQEITKTKHNCIYKVDVFDSSDNLVAVLQINGFIS